MKTLLLSAPISHAARHAAPGYGPTVILTFGFLVAIGLFLLGRRGSGQAVFGCAIIGTVAMYGLYLYLHFRYGVN